MPSAGEAAGVAKGPPAAPPSDAVRDPSPDLDELAGEAGSIRDGIAGIAGGLEALLARLRVRVSHVTVRVELPPLPPALASVAKPAPGAAVLGGPALLPVPATEPTRSVVVLRLAELRYAGGPQPSDADASQTPASAALGVLKTQGEPAAAAESAAKLYKSAEFAGLTVELYQDGGETQDEAWAAAEAVQGHLSSSCPNDTAGTSDTGGNAGSIDERVTMSQPDALSADSAAADDLGYVVICSPDGIGCAAGIAVPSYLAALVRT